MPALANRTRAPLRSLSPVFDGRTCGEGDEDTDIFTMVADTKPASRSAET